MRRLLLAPALLSLGLSGCASRGAVPRVYPRGPRPLAVPADVPAPPPPAAPAAGEAVPAASPDPVVREVMGRAQSLEGTPYRQGGTDPDGFDCSGFVQYVFRESGIALPRSVRGQQVSGVAVDEGDLRAGDLVFFAIDRRTVSHVGIATGPDAFIHAPSSRGVVRREQLSTEYWASRYAGARRVR